MHQNLMSMEVWAFWLNSYVKATEIEKLQNTGKITVVIVQIQIQIQIQIQAHAVTILSKRQNI
jgi:hypothetical protein